MQGKTFLVIGVITCILLIVFAVGLILFILDIRDKRKEKQEKTELEAGEPSRENIIIHKEGEPIPRYEVTEQSPAKKKNIRPVLSVIIPVIILGIAIAYASKANTENVQTLGSVFFIAFFVFLILLVIASIKGWQLKKGIIATCTCLAVSVVCMLIGANNAKQDGIASVYASPKPVATATPRPESSTPTNSQVTEVLLHEGDKTYDFLAIFISPTQVSELINDNNTSLYIKVKEANIDDLSLIISTLGWEMAGNKFYNFIFINTEKGSIAATVSKGTPINRIRTFASSEDESFLNDYYREFADMDILSEYK